jgi:hypothetical protein
MKTRKRRPRKNNLRLSKLKKRNLKKVIKGGNIFHFYNRFHYGDNILNLKFFYNISNILKEKNIKIYYYYDSEYIKDRIQLQKYINTEVLTLLPLTEKPDNAIELWMGKPIDGITHSSFDKFYDVFYKMILKHIGLDNIGIDTSLFQNEPYLQDIYNNLDNKFKDLDILINNNPVNSGQYDYNKEQLDALCIKLSNKYKIATSSPVNDTIPSTMRDGLTMQQFGAISTHAKHIISPNSGAFVSCLNKDTQNSVKKWIILQKQEQEIKFSNAINYVKTNIIGDVEKYI